MLLIIGEGGTIPIRNESSWPSTNKNMPVAAGLAPAAVVIIAGFAALQSEPLAGAARRNLASQPLAVVVARDRGARAGHDRGHLACSTLNRSANPNVRARPGRAVCGAASSWAAAGRLHLRRSPAPASAGTSTRSAATPRPRAAPASTWPASRILVFVICSTMAAIAASLLASRLATRSTPSAGGGNTLLYAVGAAVIGGTSLFGGKGRVRDAVIGGLVDRDHRQRPGPAGRRGRTELHHHRQRCCCSRRASTRWPGAGRPRPATDEDRATAGPYTRSAPRRCAVAVRRTTGALCGNGLLGERPAAEPLPREGDRPRLSSGRSGGNPRTARDAHARSR